MERGPRNKCNRKEIGEGKWFMGGNRSNQKSGQWERSQDIVIRTVIRTVPCLRNWDTKVRAELGVIWIKSKVGRCQLYSCLQETLWSLNMAWDTVNSPPSFLLLLHSRSGKHCFCHSQLMRSIAINRMAWFDLLQRNFERWQLPPSWVFSADGSM